MQTTEVNRDIHTHTLPTGRTLVESTLFPRHFNEITLNQSGIYVQFTSVPSWSSSSVISHCAPNAVCVVCVVFSCMRKTNRDVEEGKIRGRWEVKGLGRDKYR
jgi:hypothetical protein